MNLIKLLCVVILFLGSFNTSAQEIEEQEQYKNQISIVVTDLIDGTLQLKYERLLGKHISVGLGLGIRGEDGLIRLSGLDTEHIKTSDIFYSGFKIIPEVKYYVNKTQQYSMDGFYFGAYVKHSNFKSDINGTYTDDAEQKFLVAFEGEISVTSVGFMIGYKLPIGKRFSIDFLIAGPGAGFHNYSFKNTTDLPESFYEDFNEALEKYSFFDELNGDFRFSSTNGTTRFTIPSFRYGITLGFSL